MKTLIILLLASATALADGSSDLAAAEQRERDASTRVWYHDMESTIAERDVATAQIRLATALKQHDKALREEATNEEREAQARLGKHVRELERARVDLQAATEQRTKLERVARRR
jgi:hypothetical protein